VTDSVKHILGREPIAIEQWVLENAASFRG
jgi:hypothetical protein